jgi:4-hydroxy 2-oxovalerate aldolase
LTAKTQSLGFAGVYGSFLRPAEILAETYDLETRMILLETGKRPMVAAGRPFYRHRSQPHA